MEAIVPERLAGTTEGLGLQARAPQANTPACLALPLALLGLSLGAVSTAVQAATCVEEYCYDSVGRLNAALLCGTEYRYTYDAAGNRTGRTVSAGTSPLVCDADSDGLPDTAETATGSWVSAADTGTDPFLADTDGDSLADGVETNTGSFASASDTGTDPHVADTDGDGVDDGAEVAAGTDPNNPPAAVPAVGPLGLGVLAGLLLLAGGLLAWRNRRARGLTVALLLAAAGQALLAAPARAAVCGPGAVTLGVGDAKTTQIRAAAADEVLGDTSYTLVSNTAPATLSPASQNTSQFANFQITGTALGSGTAQIDWLAPSGSSGSCTVNIDVVAAPPPPTSANNRDAPAWDEVDLYTGERLAGPWALLDLGGPLPLGFSMGYASARTRDGQLASSLGDGWSHSFDFRLFSAGSETRIALPSGRTLRFGEAGGIYTLVGPLETPYQLVADGAEHVLLHPGSHLRYRFNASGQLVSIFDRNGNTLTLGYNGQLLSQVSDGLGRVLTFGYDANHFLAQVSDATRTVAFSVAARQLAQVTDAEGNATGFAYSNAVPDTPGLLTQITYADGTVPYTFGYGASGRIATRTAAPVLSGGTGGAVAFALAGTTATVTDEAGGTWTFTVDAEGNVLSTADPNAATSTWSYGAQGRPTGFVDAEGRGWTFAYEATSGAVSQVSRPDTATATVAYAASTDALGLTDVEATSWTDFDGRTGGAALDAAGNVTSATDAAGQTWTFSHNATGQLSSSTSPTGVAVAFSYNADGTLASATDAAGNVTTLVYDPLKRLAQVNHPDATTFQQALNANNQLTDSLDPLGQHTQIGRDPLGRAALVIDPALGNWETFFDAMGAFTGDADPLGNGSNVSYDERELPGGFGDASGRTTQVGYNASGHATSVIDNAGQVATTTVNNVGFPTSHTNRLGDTWTDVRNALGELLQVQSPLGLTWQRTVDARGRTTSATGPAGRTWTIDRDARGLTRTVIAPDGSQVSVARNASGQATSITDEIGGVWTQTLDPAGRPQTFTDPLGNAVTQTYNNRNRVIQQTFPVGLGNVNVNHDANGQLSQLAYSDGTTRDYVYDANGWLVGASGVSLTRDAAGRVTESNGIVTTRGPAGRIIQTEFGPGVWAQYGYDTNGWLQTVTDWTDPATPAIVFNRDLEGKIVSITRANGTSTTRTYNADGRLASLQHFGPGPTLLAQVTITYGADGRPASKTREADVVNPGSPHGTQSIARNAAGRPTALNGSPFTHNALGQRVSDAERTWSWRLDGTPAAITATAGGITTTIDTDALGATTAIVAGAIASTLTWNYATPMPTLAAIDQGLNVQLNLNDPVTGALLYTVDPFTGARTYVHYDENGNGWVWTDDLGNPRLTQTYSPDGQDTAHVGDPTASGLIPVGFKMACMWLDLQDVADGIVIPGPGRPPIDPKVDDVHPAPIPVRVPFTTQPRCCEIRCLWVPPPCACPESDDPFNVEIPLETPEPKELTRPATPLFGSPFPTYTWSSKGTAPDGTAYTNQLMRALAEKMFQNCPSSCAYGPKSEDRFNTQIPIDATWAPVPIRPVSGTQWHDKIGHRLIDPVAEPLTTYFYQVRAFDDDADALSARSNR